MAVNGYIKLDGVDGPSTSKSGHIELFSFSMGASQMPSINEGQLRAGKADVSHISVMKALDKTSPTLFDYCVSGKFFKKVEIIYDKASGSGQVDYFKLTMEDSMITSFQLSGSSENPTESLSFAFQKITVSYNPEKVDGSMAGFVDKGYDLTTLKAK